jgi:hypothetical protein
MQNYKYAYIYIHFFVYSFPFLFLIFLSISSSIFSNLNLSQNLSRIANIQEFQHDMHFSIFICCLTNIISLIEYAQIKENQVISNGSIILKPYTIILIHLYHYYYYYFL